MVMENKGLLFIPDISGFSRFVTETEIGHSRLIIQELLEILIESNEIGLEISEIEGDAILFYKFGEPPPVDALYRQVEKMFCAFHKNLLAYEQHRYCQCKACITASTLTLKVITHYGEFAGYRIQNFSKLIGKDVIVAHQLLKNDIPAARILDHHPQFNRRFRPGAICRLDAVDKRCKTFRHGRHTFSLHAAHGSEKTARTRQRFAPCFG